MILHKEKCVKTCPLGYYEKKQTCQKCEKNCKRCENGKDCVACFEPFYLHKNDCKAGCP
jgi:hypothetical protein